MEDVYSEEIMELGAAWERAWDEVERLTEGTIEGKCALEVVRAAINEACAIEAQLRFAQVRAAILASKVY